jgi:tetratricopeptide (TPR) repeat protein
MRSTLDRSLAAVRRRSLWSAWWHSIGLHAAVAMFAAGAAILAVRVGAHWTRPDAAWWLALALAAPLSAWWVSRSKVPGRASCATWLDVRGGASGLVVTHDELGETPWTERAEQCLEDSLRALPPIECARALRTSAPAALFVALALWIEPPAAVVGPPPAVADAAIERVEEQLVTLEEVLELEPELAAELQDQLEHVRAESEEGRAESAFEALDHLEQELERHAAQAEQAAHRAQHGLASAVNDPSLAEAQAALEDALSEMADAGLGKELPESLQTALTPGAMTLPEGVQLSSAQLAKLSQELKGVLDLKLGKLVEGRLLDASALGKLGKLGSLDDFDDTHECDEECEKPGGT